MDRAGLLTMATVTKRSTASAVTEPGGSVTAQATVEAASLSIGALETGRLLVPIVGTTPLIMHKWSEKAKRQMLEAQQGVKRPKENRDPEEEYLSTIYRFADGSAGFPVIAFKNATVGAARYFARGVKMTDLRQFLFVNGKESDDRRDMLAPIIGEHHSREDMVRVGQGTDLRYRAEFSDWRTILDITYVKTTIDQASILSLIHAAGLGVGVGEWRPERKGANGTFALDTDRAVEAIG
jgi:hypothetical protein